MVPKQRTYTLIEGAGVHTVSKKGCRGWFLNQVPPTTTDPER